MYKATRDLIKNRQKYSKYLIEKVLVKQIGGGEANECFDNAYDMLDHSNGIKMTSGWLVGKFNKYTNSTEIVQHYWNIDKFGNYFDTTPRIGPHFEYVIDCEISCYSQQNYEQVDSCVASSLLLKDGEFLAVDTNDNGSLIFRKIESLDTKNLFEKATKETIIDESTAYGIPTISITEYMDFVLSQNPHYKIYA